LGTGSGGSPVIRAPRSVEAAPAAVPSAATASSGVIDAQSWPGVVDGAELSGMVRQFALNCVPKSFEQNLLTLKLDQVAADRRTRQIEDKLVQGLSKYFGRSIRLAFDTAHSDLATPARRRLAAEQDKSARALGAFEEDPAVRGLRERFGAEVDTESVKAEGKGP